MTGEKASLGREFQELSLEEKDYRPLPGIQLLRVFGVKDEEREEGRYETIGHMGFAIFKNVKNHYSHSNAEIPT